METIFKVAPILLCVLTLGLFGLLKVATWGQDSASPGSILTRDLRLPNAPNDVPSRGSRVERKPVGHGEPDSWFGQLLDVFRGRPKEEIAGLISVLVTLASLFVILSQRFPAETEKWALGAMGMILGYWLN